MDRIAGIIYPDVFQVEELVLPMIHTMEHRGGEGKAIYTYKNAQIGICCHGLASDEKKQIHVGLDGTIDNLPELVRELKGHGYHHLEKDPKQPIVFAYELWGPSFIEHLDGDFAIVLLDQRKDHIFLARDRLGKKPLYWYQNHHMILFASELKGLLATGQVPQIPAQDALASYLYFGYIPQDMSPIQGVSKLLPAHYMLIQLNQSKTITSYWSYSNCFSEKKITLDETQVLQKTDGMLTNIVQSQIPGKEPIGCFVSGGIGSASIASYLSKLAEKDQVTAYTVGFHGENDQDVVAAKDIANALSLKHCCETLTPDNFLNDFVKIAWYLDEPLADPNIIASWHLAKLAQNNTKTVFSGMGSDELLAGHTRYTFEEIHPGSIAQISQIPLNFLRTILISIFHAIYKPLTYKLLRGSQTNHWQFEYLRDNALFRRNMLAEAAPKLSGLFDPEVFLHKFHQLPKIQSTVNSFLYFDVKTRLADCFMLQYERVTAAHSLDWRAPFLDRSLVEFFARLPELEKLSENETARLLKALMRDIFPSTVIDRPKVTRKDLLAPWVSQSELKKLFPLLLKGTLVETGFISQEWLLNQLKEIHPESFPYLWAVFSLEVWFRLYINRPTQQSPPEISLMELLLET